MDKRADPGYRQAYERGWKTSNNVTDGSLERADARGEPDAWYDGYHDAAAGREKWHLATCPDHDQCQNLKIDPDVAAFLRAERERSVAAVRSRPAVDFRTISKSRQES